MAFQSVPDCAEAVIRATFGGKEIVNVLGFRIPGGYLDSDLENLAALVDARVGSDYLPVCNDSVFYVETHVRGLALLNDLEATDDTSAGNGAISGAGMPANVSCCITLRSAFTGRSARGRFYAFPTSAANQVGLNTWDPDYTAALVAFLDGIKTDAFAASWRLAVISRFTLNAKRDEGVSFDITSISARNNLIDSQRGRLPKGH